QEWQEFLGHFERRKGSTGTCARPFGTPGIHEHACVRCPMLWPDPAQRHRLVEIRDNLHARIAEAPPSSSSASPAADRKTVGNASIPTGLTHENVKIRG